MYQLAVLVAAVVLVMRLASVLWGWMTQAADL